MPVKVKTVVAPVTYTVPQMYTHAVPSVGVPPSTETLIRTVNAAGVVQSTCVSHGPTVAGATQTLIETDPLPPWSTKNENPEYENYRSSLNFVKSRK